MSAAAGKLPESAPSGKPIGTVPVQVGPAAFSAVCSVRSVQYCPFSTVLLGLPAFGAARSVLSVQFCSVSNRKQIAHK